MQLVMVYRMADEGTVRASHATVNVPVGFRQKLTLLWASTALQEPRRIATIHLKGGAAADATPWQAFP